MFKRVLVEDWVQYVPVVSFGLFFTIFLVVAVRALRMRKAEREHMASLPLDKDDGPES